MIHALDTPQEYHYNDSIPNKESQDFSDKNTFPTIKDLKSFLQSVTRREYENLLGDIYDLPKHYKKVFWFLDNLAMKRVNKGCVDVWISQKTLSQKTNLSVQQINRAIQSLKSTGFLLSKRGRAKVNCYYINYNLIMESAISKRLSTDFEPILKGHLTGVLSTDCGIANINDTNDINSRTNNITSLGSSTSTEKSKDCYVVVPEYDKIKECLEDIEKVDYNRGLSLDQLPLPINEIIALSVKSKVDNEMIRSAVRHLWHTVNIKNLGLINPQGFFYKQCLFGNQNGTNFSHSTDYFSVVGKAKESREDYDFDTTLDKIQTYKENNKAKYIKILNEYARRINMDINDPHLETKVERTIFDNVAQARSFLRAIKKSEEFGT